MNSLNQSEKILSPLLADLSPSIKEKDQAVDPRAGKTGWRVGFGSTRLTRQPVKVNQYTTRLINGLPVHDPLKLTGNPTRPINPFDFRVRLFVSGLPNPNEADQWYQPLPVCQWPSDHIWNDVETRESYGPTG